MHAKIYQREGTVDIATTQLKSRFTSMKEIANGLSAKNDNLFGSANLSSVQYPDDLSPELPIQFISFRKVMRSAIEENKRPQ